MASKWLPAALFHLVTNPFHFSTLLKNVFKQTGNQKELAIIWFLMFALGSRRHYKPHTGIFILLPYHFPIQWINFPYRSNLGSCIHIFELLFIIPRSSPVVRFFFSLASLSFLPLYWLPCTCKYTPVKASFLFSLASLSLHFLNLAFTLMLERWFNMLSKQKANILIAKKTLVFPSFLQKVAADPFNHNI